MKENVLKKVFDMYKSEDCTFMWQRDIQKRDGHIYATSGRRLIAIPEEKCTFEFVEPDRPGSPIQFLLDIQQDPFIDRTLNITADDIKDPRGQKMVSCEDCSGEGRVVWRCDIGGDEHKKLGACPICNGKGEVPENSEWGNNYRVKIFRAMFYAPDIELLLKASEMLGEPIRLRNMREGGRPSWFSIGECEIYIMSTYEICGEAFVDITDKVYELETISV